MSGLRFFIDVETLAPGDLLTLEGEEFHHARDVIKIVEGEDLLLINGRGFLARATARHIERRRCQLSVYSVEQAQRHPHTITLAVALLRPGHMDFAVEKATELGADRLLLFPAEKSERKECSPSLLRRLDALTVAATKQSGRLFRPELLIASSLGQALAAASKAKLFCDPSADRPLSTHLASIPPSSITLYVGPESGFSPDERTQLSALATPVLIHKNILRSETAAMAAVYSASLWNNPLA